MFSWSFSWKFFVQKNRRFSYLLQLHVNLFLSSRCSSSSLKRWEKWMQGSSESWSKLYIFTEGSRFQTILNCTPYDFKPTWFISVIDLFSLHIFNKDEFNSGWFLFTSLKWRSLTLPVPCISESCIEIKIKLNFYFQASSWCLKRFYEGI